MKIESLKSKECIWQEVLFYCFSSAPPAYYIE
jgi:hypothetical protein